MKFLFLILLVFEAQAGCKSQAFIDSLDVRHFYIFRDDLEDQQQAEKYKRELHRFRATHYGRLSDEPVTHPYNDKEVKDQIISSLSL